MFVGRLHGGNSQIFVSNIVLRFWILSGGEAEGDFRLGQDAAWPVIRLQRFGRKRRALFSFVRSKRQSRRTFWPLKIQAVYFFEILESDNLPTQRHIPEELSPQQHTHTHTHIYIYLFIYLTSLRGLMTLTGAAFGLPTPRKRSEYSAIHLWICCVLFAWVYR
jgi:hypothetical protein